MRVGIDGTFLGPDARYTGMGVYTRCLVGALAALSARPDLVLLGYGPRPAAAPAGVAWCSIPALRAGKLSPWLSHQIALPRAARRLGLDLLHIPGVNLRLSQPGVPFAAPCPLAVTLHDAIPLTYYGRKGPPLPWRLRHGFRLAMLATRRAALVLTVSETARREIMQHIPLRPERVRVVLNGLEPPPTLTEQERATALRRLGVTRPYLLFAGSFEPRKNLLGVVRAYRRAQQQRSLPPLVLQVDAHSGHKDAALRTIAEEGGSDQLRFVDSVAPRDLAALYSGAALFLYPSHAEGFGFTPLQALAAGVPVIASRAGALPEVLGDCACYVAADDMEALARAIIAAIEKPAGEQAARGQARAARFRWEAAAAATLAAYADALRR